MRHLIIAVLLCFVCGIVYTKGNHKRWKVERTPEEIRKAKEKKEQEKSGDTKAETKPEEIEIVNQKGQLRPKEALPRKLPESAYSRIKKNHDKNLKRYNVHDHYYFCAKRIFNESFTWVDNSTLKYTKVHNCSFVKCFPWKYKWDITNKRDVETLSIFMSLAILMKEGSIKRHKKNIRYTEYYDHMGREYSKFSEEQKWQLVEVCKKVFEDMWKEYKYDYYIDKYCIKGSKFAKLKKEKFNDKNKWQAWIKMSGLGLIGKCKICLRAYGYKRGYNVLTERWEPETYYKLDLSVARGMLIDRVVWHGRYKEHFRNGDMIKYFHCWDNFCCGRETELYKKNWAIKVAWDKEKKRLEKLKK